MNEKGNNSHFTKKIALIRKIKRTKEILKVILKVILKYP